jgi:hypothetical protein
MGAALGSGFQAVGLEIAAAILGIDVLALVALGLATSLSVFNHAVMSFVKDAMLRVIGGTAIAASAVAIGTMLVANFKLG